MQRKEEDYQKTVGQSPFWPGKVLQLYLVVAQILDEKAQLTPFLLIITEGDIMVYLHRKLLSFFSKKLKVSQD